MSRIVAGTAGGRPLAVPRGRVTRPTSERTREGLFSTLTALLGDLAGLSFLDLYAGSGAVGLEAASRGAAPVTLVEAAAAPLAVLRRNVETLGLEQVQVRAERVERVLAFVPPLPFDVVFVDPPYADPVDDVLQLLIGNRWLAATAVVVVERSSRDAAMTWPVGLSEERMRRYGDSTLWYGRPS